MTGIRYPEIEARLVGTYGNAFATLGRVRKALQGAGLSDEEVSRFTAEATSGDYDRLLQTVMLLRATSASGWLS
jgi:hypothetical protein